MHLVTFQTEGTVALGRVDARRGLDATGRHSRCARTRRGRSLPVLDWDGCRYRRPPERRGAPRPQNLELTVHMDSELQQNSNTQHLIFSIRPADHRVESARSACCTSTSSLRNSGGVFDAYGRRRGERLRRDLGVLRNPSAKAPRPDSQTTTERTIRR